MSDAQTIYDLRIACSKPGCPVCTVTQRSTAKYIEGLLNECILDPEIREKLTDSLGLCYQHTWLSVEIKLTDALGHAILQHSLVNSSLRKLEAGGGHPGKQLAKELEPRKECPACKIDAETLERVVDSLAAGLKDPGFIADFQNAGALCLPHLRAALPKLDSHRMELVLAHQKERMSSLRDELAEFIRKNDYRFRDEAIGAEGDSYKRAADLVQGKHRPAERKDLEYK
jgi:hypothetical protein